MKTTRQEDFESLAGMGLSEAEICDLRRLSGAIEHGPTTCKTADEWWDFQRLIKLANTPKVTK